MCHLHWVIQPFVLLHTHLPLHRLATTREPRRGGRRWLQCTALLRLRLPWGRCEGWEQRLVMGHHNRRACGLPAVCGPRCRRGCACCCSTDLGAPLGNPTLRPRKCVLLRHALLHGVLHVCINIWVVRDLARCWRWRWRWRWRWPTCLLRRRRRLDDGERGRRERRRRCATWEQPVATLERSEHRNGNDDDDCANSEAHQQCQEHRMHATLSRPRRRRCTRTRGRRGHKRVCGRKRRCWRDGAVHGGSVQRIHIHVGGGGRGGHRLWHLLLLLQPLRELVRIRGCGHGGTGAGHT